MFHSPRFVSSCDKLWCVAAIVLSATASASHAPAQSYTLTHTLNDPTITTQDAFGYSVAIDGNYAVVAARYDDTNGGDAGQAHLFDATSGRLLHTLNDPTPTAGSWFGSSVAVDGDRIVVGAYHDRSHGSYRGFVGKAHLFDAVTGNVLRTFDDPTLTFDDYFGRSVAIDGNHVLIGAWGDDTNGRDVGQAHLFDATTGGLLQTFNDPTATEYDYFGFSVALDGDHVLIGARGDSTNGAAVGQAYLFDATTGNLLHTFNDPTVTRDSFGWSTALDGNHVLIGATHDDTLGMNVGQAHLFDATTGSLLHTFNDPTVTDGDLFGRSVAIHGNDILIGAVSDDTLAHDVGQVHLFDAVSGDLLQTFNDPTITGRDGFGKSVAISDSRILVGANGDNTNGSRVGQAHVYTIPEPSILALTVLTLPVLLSRRRWRRRTTGLCG